MNQQTDKAILVVSFGTSYEASRKATIEKIEQDIRNAFQDHRIYRAWTSKFIISILKKRDNYTVPTVKEAHRRDPGGGCSADPYPGRYRE